MLISWSTLNQNETHFIHSYWYWQDCSFYIDRGLLYVRHVYKWLLWVTQNCHASWIQWRNCCSISCTCTYMYELRYIDIISVCFDELILTLIVECMYRTHPLKKVEENRIYYIYLFKFFFKYIPYLQQISHVVQWFFFYGGGCNGVLHVLKCLLCVWNATRMHTFITTTSIFELAMIIDKLQYSIFTHLYLQVLEEELKQKKWKL